MRGAFFCITLDPADDIAGFVLDWAATLAAKLESLDVICLEDRRRDRPGLLPDNARVWSLGKERGLGRARMFWAAQRALAAALGRADFVLCHMMPVYALTAWPLCRLKGRRLFLWYTHQHVDLKLRLAVAAADLVFTAVPESMNVATPKKIVMGHGVNLARFAPAPPPSGEGPLNVVSVGRLSPVKRLETLVDAAVRLRELGRLDEFRFRLVGKEGSPAQAEYAAAIRRLVERRGLTAFFDFAGSTPYLEVNRHYAWADAFVSMQESRGLDKAGLEAMASGLPVLAANPSFGPLMGDLADRLLYPADKPGDLADRLMALRQAGSATRRAWGGDLRAAVAAGHDLDRLMDKIIARAGKAG